VDVIGAIIRGALLATVLAFPLAAICAALYRFPVPFAGYQSGLAAIPSVLTGAVFYGFLGGFPVLLMGGALAGTAAYTLYPTDQHRMRRLITVFAGGVAATCVALLAILDKLIGPW
jgi:hypothetical protein